MAALEGVLDELFVRWFLIEQKHTHEDLVVEIKNRYPNLKGCSVRSVKRFCDHHGIRKRMPVSDGALDTAVRAAVSEVRMCSKFRITVMNIYVGSTTSSHDNLYCCQYIIFCLSLLVLSSSNRN